MMLIILKAQKIRQLIKNDFDQCFNKDIDAISDSINT